MEFTQTTARRLQKRKRTTEIEGILIKGKDSQATKIMGALPKINHEL